METWLSFCGACLGAGVWYWICFGVGFEGTGSAPYVYPSLSKAESYSWLVPESLDCGRLASKRGRAWGFISICARVPPSEILEAFGVSSATRKSKTLTGSALLEETAGGGLGAPGGGSTMMIA